LADRRLYLPIYESLEQETAILMEKYTQQESIIQNLMCQNQELVRQIQMYQSEMDHMELQSMQSS